MPQEDLLKEWNRADDARQCVYLPDQWARHRYVIPGRRLTGPELDARLASGARRAGSMFYTIACQPCVACECTRVCVDDFTPSGSQRRILARGNRELTVRLGAPIVTQERVRLYNRHLFERGLDRGAPLDASEYRSFLVESCCETLELNYYLEDRLVAVAISDRGATSLNLVYCFFDPDYARYSLGTYSILKQWEFCRRWRIRWLYLGYYVAGSRHVMYKANFLPQERLIRGVWQAFDRDGAPQGSPS